MEWEAVDDRVDRRRVQNKLAQRAYRARVKEETAERRGSVP
jgi:hypothetical protein